MLTAIRDFFSIEGARETSAEVARIYDNVGAADRFSMFEADDGHGYTMPRRLAAYRFFSKWLEGKEDTSPEPEIRVLSEQELWCTRSGQVATEFPNGESVFTLNQKRFEQVRQRGATVDSVRKMVGYAPRTDPPRVKGYGSTAKIEKLTFESEPGIDLPAVVYLPAGSGRHQAVVIAHGRGKSAAHETAEKMAASGKLVLSIDLRGMGEMSAAQRRNGSDWPGYFGDYESAMTAMMTGKPLVTMRAEDIARAVDVLLARPDVDASRIELYGYGLAAVPALYAAAFDKRIAAVTLEGMLESYESIIRRRIHRQQWENAVQGALRHYDLPDLVRWIAPRKVTMIKPVNPLGM
jgi:dienelactone hydrolase